MLKKIKQEQDIINYIISQVNKVKYFENLSEKKIEKYNLFVIIDFLRVMKLVPTKELLKLVQMIKEEIIIDNNKN